MKEFAFIFTIFFVLLGPIKLIPSFARVTHGADIKFKRSVAIRASLIASLICFFVVLAGERMLSNYRISLDALRIAGALVLLLSALEIIFHREQPIIAPSKTQTSVMFTASTVAIPIIVPSTGIAAILIFIMLAPLYPGMMGAISISLTTMMVLDFLVMCFIDKIMRIPGLMLILNVIGSVMIFMQLCSGVQIFLNALKNMGVIK